MLTTRQKRVAAEIYQGRLSEEEIIKRHRISANRLETWLADDEFQQELHRHCQRSLRSTRYIISRFGPIAALRLAELLGSEKDDTARRAALDMIDHCLQTAEEPTPDQDASANHDQLNDNQVKQMIMSLADSIEPPKP